MTLDENLVQKVDKVVRELHTTRSAFAREALQQAVALVRIRQMEEKQRQGYLRKPVTKDEFGAWDKERAWGDK